MLIDLDAFLTAQPRDRNLPAGFLPSVHVMLVVSPAKLLNVSTANFTRAQATGFAMKSLMKVGGPDPSAPLY
ncbi:MAG: hypothetical protein ACREA9_22735 [Pyrinomonadaceae bacterium]